MTRESQTSSQKEDNSGIDKNISVEWIKELVRKELQNELERKYHEEIYKKELQFEAEHVLEDQFGIDWLGHSK